jgi:hypothetical protein
MLVPNRRRLAPLFRLLVAFQLATCAVWIWPRAAGAVQETTLDVRLVFDQIGGSWDYTFEIREPGGTVLHSGYVEDMLFAGHCEGAADLTAALTASQPPAGMTIVDVSPGACTPEQGGTVRIGVSPCTPIELVVCSGNQPCGGSGESLGWAPVSLSALDFHLVELGCVGKPYGTTVITHGFTLALDWGGSSDNCRNTSPKPPGCPEVAEPDCGGSKPDPRAPKWLYTMSEAMVSRMTGGTCTENVVDSALDATVLEYHPCTGDWVFYCGTGDPADPVILVFNWAVESDLYDEEDPSFPHVYGGAWGHTEAAGEALYASLRDPQFSDGDAPAGTVASLDGMDLLADGLHLAGHSRGTAVMTATSRWLVGDEVAVDQLTHLDPHPVDGLSGEDPFDWGDRVPGVYDGVTWSDTYWREDSNPLDFNGEDVSGSYGRNLECAFPETPLAGDHSRVHAWYHGTIDTDAETDKAGYDISESWYEVPDSAGNCTPIPARDSTGFYFTRGEGLVDRPDFPNQAPRLASSFSAKIYNGDFDEHYVPDPPGTGIGYSHAGWRFHGGNKSGCVGHRSARPGQQLHAPLEQRRDYAHSQPLLPRPTQRHAVLPTSHLRRRRWHAVREAEAGRRRSLDPGRLV